MRKTLNFRHTLNYALTLLYAKYKNSALYTLLYFLHFFLKTLFFQLAR